MSRPRNPVEGNKRERRKRTPVSGNRDILTVDGLPEGYVARWVNDKDNRLLKFQDAGYEFVQKDENITVGDRSVDASTGVDSRVSKVVDTDKFGKPLVAYLMVQKQEWYDEDQEAKKAEVDELEASMRQQHKSPGRYGKVQIE